MAEKGPWGSPDVIKLDAQLRIINDIHQQLKRRSKNTFDYEVIEGRRNEPRLTFKYLEGDWDELVAVVSEIATHADALATAHGIGRLTIERNDERKEIRLSMRS